MRITIPVLAVLASFAAVPSLFADTLVYTYTNKTSSDYITTFNVSTTGEYSIQVEGGAGGAGPTGASGGTGANLFSDFALTAGQTLYIVVGAKGSSTNYSTTVGAGGGGTYVAIQSSTNTLLIDAGGGGGAGFTGKGGNADTTNAAVGATGSGSLSGSGGTGGGNGNNSGDGGIFASGGDGYLSGNENGGAGKYASGTGGGGGGGGYNGGGAGGNAGEGGGSSYWNIADATNLTVGSGNTSYGAVTIYMLPTQLGVTPEPPSLLLLFTGSLCVLGIGYKRRHHRKV